MRRPGSQRPLSALHLRTSLLGDKKADVTVHPTPYTSLVPQLRETATRLEIRGPWKPLSIAVRSEWL